MKKILFVVIIIAMASVYGQNKMAAIKAGMFFPQACDGGFDLGLEYGMKIDTNLDVGMSLDWFKKEFEYKEYIDAVEDVNGELVGDQYKNLGDVTIYDFPLMIAITAKFPLGRQLKWFAMGGLGAEMLYASLSAYDKKADEINEETVLAFDFNWRLGGGIMYNLGQRSEVFGELAYHYSVPSIEDDSGITTEYDMSGIMSRIGVRFSFR